MDLQELLSRFAVALGIGLLIGLERGWRMREMQSGSRTAGIRTFAVSGLLGAVAAALSQAAGTGAGFVLGASFAAFAAVMIVFCREENKASGNFSATTAIAAILTFSLGAFALIGDMRVAAAAAVATAGILAAREDIHGWVAKITWPELRSALVLLAMTFIVLPIVPDDPIGPFGGVNPREIWLIAIVLAAVSFLGYLGVRVLGTRRGLLVSGAAGGLASSTAVTVANARHSIAGEGDPALLAGGVALASAISFLRVTVIVAVLHWALLRSVAPPLVAATVVAIALSLLPLRWQTGRNNKAAQRTAFRNPFAFWSVVGFAIFLGIIVVAGRAISERAGATGAILGAAAMGIADVDAITVSIASLGSRVLSDQSAAFAILSAVATNMLTKLAIGAAIGSGRFALYLAIVSVACFVAAGIALWLTLVFLPP
ncbi:MAG TPA: DUF4010 domain-containing protein [Pseudolabrys sp.]|jgi:uncharacterized membrane protein (DUF4010 family)